MSRLPRDFFARDTLVVARDLLGCTLVHQVNGERIAGRIVEVEAYTGWDDAASHGHRGRTPRNGPMFEEVGFSYVYFVYGMCWLLNVVAKPPDVEYPAAVLLRALEPVEGLDHMAHNRAGHPEHQWTNGPGKLTRALGIGKDSNHRDMTAGGSLLFFEPGQPINDQSVETGPRVGINVSEPSRSLPWRFWIKGNTFVSQMRKGS